MASPVTETTLAAALKPLGQLQNYSYTHCVPAVFLQARTQDFEKGGSEYRVAVRPRRGGGCWRGMCSLPRKAQSFYTMDDLECQIFIQIY